MKELHPLIPRIEAMARKQLNEDFLQVKSFGAYSELHVRPGTSRRKRSELRDLFGWIALFNTEE